MESFEVNNSECDFFMLELDDISDSLKYKLGKRRLPDLSTQIEEFRKLLLNEYIFHEEIYLETCRDIILKLLPYNRDDTILKIILDFSRINCELRSVYEELNLIETLAYYICRCDYGFTPYNRILINDLIYYFYFYELKKRFDEGGLEQTIEFLEKRVQKLSDKNQLLIVRTALLSLSSDKKSIDHLLSVISSR